MPASAFQPEAGPAAGAPPTGPGGFPIDPAVLQLLAEAEQRAPAQRLGLRASVARSTQVVMPVVVIVPSPVVAAEVIANWQGSVRFPVLIDDGSPGATEDIARFVRAFEPESVVRWAADVPAMPTDRVERRRRIATLWTRSIKLATPSPDPVPTIRAFRESGLGINGAVVVDGADDAWAAGLALAAARHQVLLFAESSGRVGSVASPRAAERLAEVITVQLNGLGLKWNRLGDDIDAVTLVFDNFTKINDAGYRGPNTQTSITDRLCRREPPTGPRWAWSGMIHGSGAEAMYRVMCSLFLPIESAWLFDGYEGGTPWDTYDLTAAGKHLDDAGLSVSVFDLPNNGSVAWRRATARGLSSDLVMINSKGLVGNFDLGGETLSAGTTPVLRRPAVGVMVHSWSASEPARATSIAGRWFEHGVYAWYGSIQEPTLAAFVASPSTAQRMGAGLPFGAAVAYDDGPAWKLLFLGDPLITTGIGSAAGRRANAVSPINGSVDLEEEMRTAVGEGRFAAAIRALVMLGRDTDVARLAVGLLRDRPESFDADAAASALMPLFRDGRIETMVRAFTLAEGRNRRTVQSTDALWHGVLSLPRERVTTDMVEVLGANLRRGEVVDDALVLALLVRDQAGGGEAGNRAAARVLSAIADDLTQEGWSTRIRQLAGEFLDGRR
ncbi:MAG: hypothetical protein AAF297_04875 [Planctomycetota bacterium]